MSTTITNILDESAIVTDQGSAYWTLAEVVKSGTSLVLDSNVIQGPLLKSWEAGVTKDKKEIEDCQGVVRPLSGGKTTGSGKAVAIQQDINTLKFAETYGGNYFVITHEVNDSLVNGKNYLEIIPYGLLDSTRKISKPGGEVEIGYTPTKSPAELTLTLATHTSGFNNPATSGTVTIPAGTYTYLHEYTP